jgi:hypothetical protein
MACGPTPGYNACDPPLSARRGEINNRSREAQIYVALTRIIGTRQIWLWEGVVRGTPLEWWRTDVWNLVAVRLTDVLSIVVIFNDHATHPERQLIVDKGAGVD